MIAFVQSAPHLAGNILYIYIASVKNYKTQTYYNMQHTDFFFFPIFFYTNSTIVILGNHHLWKWLNKQRKQLIGWSSFKKSTSDTGNINNVPLDIAIVNDSGSKEDQNLVIGH